MNRIKADAEVELVLVAALLDELIDDTMQTTLSEREHANYGSDAVIMTTVTKTGKRDLIVAKSNRVYTERTHLEVQNSFEETLVDILQLGNSAPSYGIRTVSVWFLETVVKKLFGSKTGKDIASECLEQWTMSDKFMKAFVKQIISAPFLLGRWLGL